MTTYDSTKAIADVSQATLAALKARFKELAGVVDAVGAERKALLDEISRREKEVAIGTRFSTLSDADRAMYKEVVNSPTFSKR